jgi:Flp pilus assembly protein TadG
MKKNMIAPLLIIMSLVIVSVSAFVYYQVSNSVTQTIDEVANITLNQGTLGNIEEGQTILYTPSNTTSLNDIISTTTSKANVYLHFDTNLNEQNTNYATFQIVVKVGDTVPVASSNSTGDTTAILTIANPDTNSGVALDAAGAWTFDFEITTTANSVSSNQATTVNIVVSAESTSA